MGSTLHTMLRQSNAIVVKEHLNANADPNYPRKISGLLLLIAVARGRDELVLLLLA